MSKVTRPVQHAIRGMSSVASSSRGGYSYIQTRSGQNDFPDVLSGNDKIIRAYHTTRPRVSSSSDFPDVLTGNDKIIRPYSTQTQRPRFSAAARLTPLLQGFSTSTLNVVGNAEIRSVDNWVFPVPPAEAHTNPFMIRVPLMPDAYVRSSHAAIEADPVVMERMEKVVAAVPENVSAISEIVGDESRDFSLTDLTSAIRGKITEVQEPGALKSLWNDVLDDVLGQKGAKLAKT